MPEASRTGDATLPTGDATLPTGGGTVSRRGGTLPWWLGPGAETCRFCSRSYAWEAQRRCSGCDAPFCPFCVGSAAGASAACPQCGPSAGR